MYSKAKYYRPLPGYENLYEVNRLHNIKPLNREIIHTGRTISLKQNPPIIKTVGKTIYAIIRDENFKNRKINVTNIVRNVFGRQKPIKVGRPRESIHVVKPINKNGRAGISVEQYEDGKMIGVFPTFASAAKAVGGESRYVSDAAYGKRAMYAGYKWKFKQ